jgi:hypothetical protein
MGAQSLTSPCKDAEMMEGAGLRPMARAGCSRAELHHGALRLGPLSAINLGWHLAATLSCATLCAPASQKWQDTVTLHRHMVEPSPSIL